MSKQTDIYQPFYPQYQQFSARKYPQNKKEMPVGTSSLEENEL